MAYDLKLFRFAGADNGPHLLITGGVHGDEFESIAAIRSKARYATAFGTRYSVPG
jgi:hypothetical protein